MPWVFAVLATWMLAAGVVAFWQSVRAALGLIDLGDVRSDGALDEDAALFARKRAVLEGLRELDFDHEAGKLSDEDHARERERLRAEARDALRSIDQALGPHRAAAESLVASRLAGELSRDASVSTPESLGVPAGERTASSTMLLCKACETENDPDAHFCKRCGAVVSEVRE